MREIWLRPNRRAILFGCVLPALAAIFAGWILVSSSWLGQWHWYGLAVLVLSVGTLAMLLTQLLRPRVAFSEGRVLFYLDRGSPIAVPVQVVEAFFAGQGPAHLPAMSN